MKTGGSLTDATFVRRPNRFLTIVRINGREEESHLPDPGRLKELLVHGVRLKVRRVAEEKRENRRHRGRGKAPVKALGPGKQKQYKTN